MQKSLVIRAERKLPRAVLIIGGVVVGALAVVDLSSALNLVIVGGSFWFLGVGNPRVIFGEKFLNIQQEILAETLINYRNIKGYTEKRENSRHGERTKITIQLHDEREIELDVTLFKPEDRKRIRELLVQKIAACESMRS